MNPNLKGFLQDTGDGVYYPGHASSIVRLDSALVALDPCWGPFPLYGSDWWKFIPQQVDCDAVVPELDGCIVSHLHQDHFCERVLRRVREARVPILIMQGRPDFEAKFHAAGIPFQTAPPWKWVRAFRPGLEVYFVPNPHNQVDSSCFLRHRVQRGYCIYHGNDNFLDAKSIDRFLPDIEHVDVAMVPYAFINWYPWLLDNLTQEEQAVEAQRLRRQSLDQALALIKALKPGVIIPFGNNIFYDDGWDHPLNLHLANPFDLCILSPVLTGDWVCGDRFLSYDGRNSATYDDDICRSLGARWRTPMKRSVTIMDNGLAGYQQARDDKRDSLANVPGPPDDHQIVICGVALDGLELREPRTEFEIDAPLFNQWLAGEITFEHVIGTRRFRCWRVPNVYRGDVLQWCYRWL